MGKENYAICHLILILLLNTVDYKLVYDNGYNCGISQNLFFLYTIQQGRLMQVNDLFSISYQYVSTHFVSCSTKLKNFKL